MRWRRDYVIDLPHADDESVVMTRSFTNMLLALQVIATLVAGADDLLAELHTLPNELRPRLSEMRAFAAELGARADLRRFVYLGLGPNYGLAAEATLKLKEMTQVECEPYNPLEFRHGAISIVREDTAVVLLEGMRERDYIGDVEAHVKQIRRTRRRDRALSLGPRAFVDRAAGRTLGRDALGALPAAGSASGA